jgi:mannitol/fructose-specific phosphotransferase system IIA component
MWLQEIRLPVKIKKKKMIILMMNNNLVKEGAVENTIKFI